MDETELLANIFFGQCKGLLHTARANLTPVQQKFAQSFERMSGWRVNNGQIRLIEVIENISATILIGVSSQPGQFTAPIIKDGKQG